MRSGGTVDLTFVVADKYGTIVRTDSESKLQIKYQSIEDKLI